MNTLDQRLKQVEAEIQFLSRQVDEKDGKIRAFLSDRQNKPHPRHLELIEKIQGYRLDPNVSSKYLMTLLDNLQWKLYYSKRAWKQLWDNVEALRRRENANNAQAQVVPESDSSSHVEEIHSKAQYSVDTLWEIQKEKFRVYGITEAKETKSEFKRRMIKEYKKLSRDKKSSQEIIMTFDKDSMHCKLGVK